MDFNVFRWTQTLRACVFVQLAVAGTVFFMNQLAVLNDDNLQGTLSLLF